MKKYFKIYFIYIFLFIMLITIHDIILIKYCRGESTQIDKKEFLQELSILDKANKMVIETNSISLNLYQKIEVIDLKDVKYITNELKNISQIDGIETECDYKVTFFNDGRELFKFDLSIDLEYPDSSFIRLHDIDDYLINRACYDFFVSIIHIERKIDQPLTL
jgi:hypothetical protein